MKKFTRICSFALILMTLVSILSVNAFAESWPSLEGGYIELSAAFQFDVFRDAELQTRGTSNPAKSYNAYVAAGDLVRIYELTSNYILLDYPTSSGRKLAYASTAKVLGRTSPAELIISQAKVTTYKTPTTQSGSVSIGDQVYKMGTTKGHALIIYTAENPNGRKFKAAYVTKEDYEKMKGGEKITETDSYTALSYALYQQSGGKISCGFDGYINTKGRHEGIDFQIGYGQSIYSLTDGYVTRITYGSDGSNGLSTIAIFYPSANMSIIYLHCAPLNSLSKGDTVTKGQLLGTEGYRGASSTHTHVEVRTGLKSAAAKSVGDEVLENENPTGFWNSLGYSVK